MAVLHAPARTGKTLVIAGTAADQFRTRIALNCGHGGSQVVVRIFQGPCAWMLRCEAKQTSTRFLVVSTGLAKAGVPHLTIEQYEFFRRQEVKDAIA